MPLRYTGVFDSSILSIVASFCENPGALASTCKAAYAAIALDARFKCVWFHRWHAKLAPFRPWQYAAVTWRRMRAASAQQLAEFLVEYHEYQQQVLLHSTTQPRYVSTAATATGASPAAEQGGEHCCPQEDFIQKPHQAFPTCPLLPSDVRAAKQWLRKSSYVRALLQLCTASSQLLLAYSAKAGNRRLIQEIINWQRSERRRSSYLFYPTGHITNSHFTMNLEQQRLMFYGAVKAGHSRLLRSLLQQMYSESPYFVKKLISFTARHGNAACLHEVMSYRESESHHNLPFAALSPQHLAIAAARTDPWAADVVALLLHALKPKQLKPSYMKEAYIAACSSNNRAVLQHLLMVAAAAPEQQLEVLLSAAGAAGNPAVLQELLQLGSQSQQSGAAAHGSQGPKDSNQDQLPRLDWHEHVDMEQLIAALSVTLPTMAATSKKYACSKWSALGYKESENRLQLADQIWQHLVIEAGREQELREFLQDSEGVECIEDYLKLSTEFISQTADEAEDLLSPASAVWLLRKQLVTKDTQRVSVTQMVPEICAALTAGQAGTALKLFMQLKQETAGAAPADVSVLYSMWSMAQSRVISSIIKSRMTAAAARADTTEFKQLDLLRSLIQGPLGSAEVRLCTLVFQTSVFNISVSNIKGEAHRIATFGMVAQALGMCWQLLERLLLQAVQRAVASGKQDASWFLKAKAAVTADLEFEQRLSEVSADEQIKMITQKAGSITDFCLDSIEKYESLIQSVSEALGADASVGVQEMIQSMLQYLRSKIAAGEVLQPIPQVQQGPLPLWQQAALQVAATHLSASHGLQSTKLSCSTAAAGLLHGELLSTERSSMLNSSGDSCAPGLQAAQRFLTDDACSFPSSQRSPWAKTIAKTVILTGNTELQHWSANPEQSARLWGSDDLTVVGSAVLWELALKGCSPISNKWTRTIDKQQQDLLQYQHWLESKAAVHSTGTTNGATLCSSQLPQFAQAAVATALPLLDMARRQPCLLSKWLELSITRSSSAVDLMRAKAVLAAVLAAKELPAGAHILKKAALQRHIVPTGDIDLIGMSILWAKRLPIS